MAANYVMLAIYDSIKQSTISRGLLLTTFAIPVSRQEAADMPPDHLQFNAGTRDRNCQPTDVRG